MAASRDTADRSTSSASRVADGQKAWAPRAAFKQLGFSASKGYQLLRDGVLVSIKIGGTSRIPDAELERVIAEGLVEARAAAQTKAESAPTVKRGRGRPPSHPAGTSE